MFQMAAAHLKVFPIFLLFIMLTSGSLRGTWLWYRNYISFVGEYFYASDGQKSSGWVSITIPVKSCVSHRITEWWGLEGPSVGPPVQPPAEAGSPRAGCTGLRPGRSGISPEKETPQPPWSTCSSAPSFECSFFSAFLLRASSLLVVITFLYVCGDVRKTSKDPLEVCGVFCPLM